MNKVSPGPVSGNTGNCIKEAVCIHTDKVYDSCREQECTRQKLKGKTKYRVASYQILNILNFMSHYVEIRNMFGVLILQATVNL